VIALVVGLQLSIWASENGVEASRDLKAINQSRDSFENCGCTCKMKYNWGQNNWGRHLYFFSSFTSNSKLKKKKYLQ